MSSVKDVSRRTVFTMKNLATYTSADTFDQHAAIGFIKLWGLPSKVHAEIQAQQQLTETLI